MKQLAATLSRQRGIEYEFGPEFKEYLEKKASQTLGEQLRSIPVHNKAGENYFGHMSEQLRSKGGSVFKAISNHLAQVKLRSCIWKGCRQHVERQGVEVKAARNCQN